MVMGVSCLSTYFCDTSLISESRNILAFVLKFYKVDCEFSFDQDKKRQLQLENDNKGAIRFELSFVHHC